MKSLFLISAALVPAALAQSAAWAQCGGIGFTGSTTCVSGYTCSYVNSYYSQCIPGTAAATSTSGASTPVQSALQSLCTQYAYASVNGYDLLNNLWGIAQATSGSQCTYYLGAVGSGISFSTAWTWAGGENDVKSYAYAGRQITRKLISSISSLPTTVNWNYNTTNIRANVAYDIFTAADVNHSQSSGDYELMIWLNRYGGVWPITSTGSAIATVTIAGYSWDVYFGYNGAMKVYSFLAVNGPLTSFTADVKLFFNYLTSNQGFPASSQYMLIYQFGTEAFTGGPALMTVSQFNAAVN